MCIAAPQKQVARPTPARPASRPAPKPVTLLSVDDCQPSLGGAAIVHATATGIALIARRALAAGSEFLLESHLDGGLALLLYLVRDCRPVADGTRFWVVADWAGAITSPLDGPLAADLVSELLAAAA